MTEGGRLTAGGALCLTHHLDGELHVLVVARPQVDVVHPLLLPRRSGWNTRGAQNVFKLGTIFERLKKNKDIVVEVLKRHALTVLYKIEK